MKPTDSELEILQILWEQGPCSVRHVNDQLNLIKESGYTTTLKLMQIMNQKGLAERDTTSRTHIYTATAKEERTKAQLLTKFMKNTFKGSASQLVMSALGSGQTTKEELQEIRALLNKIESETK